MSSGNGLIYAGLGGPHETVHDQQGGLVGSLDQSDAFVTPARSDGVVAVHDRDFTEFDLYSATGELYRTFDASFSNCWDGEPRSIVTEPKRGHPRSLFPRVGNEGRSECSCVGRRQLRWLRWHW